MAWVNRTTRDNNPTGLPASATTSAHVGPGYYETSPSRRVRPNAAGFGSNAEVERGGAGVALVTPGPGTYGGVGTASWESPSKSQAPASSAFVSKSQRLGEVKTKKGDSTPGPGAYTKQDSFAKKKTRSSLGNLLVREPPKNSKVKWTRLPTAPSIPTQSQSFGYEQGPYGKLVRHEPATVGHTGKGSDTLGPGEYDPLRDLKRIHKTRAADFSKGKVTRIFEQEARTKEAVPGPGQYRDPTDGSLTKDPARASAIFKSSLTRETASKGNAKQLVPGPGAYYSNNQASGFAGESKPEHLQFFGSTTTRFESSHRELGAPGPGSYYNPPVATSAGRPVSGREKKKAAFSSKKERFEAQRGKDQSLAAPGSYEVQSALSETLNKTTSRVRTFGSTTRRFEASPSSMSSVPETAEALLDRDMQVERSSQPSSVRKRLPPKVSSSFASTTTRFQPHADDAGPSPGDYEIHRSWDSAGAHGAFKSGIERMPQQSPKTSIPGPGAYSTAPVKQKPVHMARPDVFFGAEPRFKAAAAKTPTLGPGHYNTDTVESDWNRPTHNISIATEMELAMLH